MALCDGQLLGELRLALAQHPVLARILAFNAADQPGSLATLAAPKSGPFAACPTAAGVSDVGRGLGLLPRHCRYAASHGRAHGGGRRHDLLHRAHVLPSDGAVHAGAAGRRGAERGWNAQQHFESDDLIDQMQQALLNVRAVLAEAGASPEHMVRMNWFITDRDEYQLRPKQLGSVYREVMGRHFPAMSCVQVAALVEPRAKVEIEVTAVVPD